MQAWPDIQGAQCRLHPIGAPHKQIILERKPKPVQCVTDRRGRETKPLARLRDASLLKQSVKHSQEIEVKMIELNWAHQGTSSSRPSQPGSIPAGNNAARAA